MLHFAGHWDQKDEGLKVTQWQVIFAMESKLIFLLLRQQAPNEATGAKPHVTTLRLTTLVSTFPRNGILNLEGPSKH